MSEPRRFAFIYDAVFPYIVGGVEHRNYMLARELSRRHDVAIYGFSYWEEQTTDERLPQCRYMATGRPMPLHDAQSKRRLDTALHFARCLLRPLLRSTESFWDVANFPYFSVPVARFAAWRRQATMIVTWHECLTAAEWRRYSGRLWFLGSFIQWLALRCTPHAVAVSGHTQKRLLAAGVSPEHLTLIPNPVELERIDAVAPHAEAVDLIYAGRLIAHKQVPLLLEAVDQLRRDLPQVRLDIIGRGPQEPEIRQMVAERGLASHVRFLGFLEDQTELFARFKSARVLVIPSRREGFGMTVVQAWACGLPAVVCDEPASALVDLIDAPLKGRCVPSTAEALAGACRDLLSGPLPDRIALRQCADEYDVRRIAAKFEALMARLRPAAPLRPEETTAPRAADL